MVLHPTKRIINDYFHRVQLKLVVYYVFIIFVVNANLRQSNSPLRTEKYAMIPHRILVLWSNRRKLRIF